MSVIHAPMFSSGDPYWEDVVLLMHMDGPGATDFIDVKGHTFFRAVGSNAAISSTHSAFGGYSLYSPSSSYGSTDYILNIAADDSWHILDNMTWEMWIYETSTPSAGTLIFGVSLPTGSSVDSMVISIGSGNKLVVDLGAYQILGTTAISLNTPHHIAVVKSGSSLDLYLDGILEGSGAASNNTSLTHCVIGAALRNGTTILPFGNFVDEVRITRRARDPSTFPPTGPFPNG